MSIEELYNDKILRRAKNPFHFEEPQQGIETCRLVADNPICGDSYTLFLKIEDDRIVDTWFHGFGCALSKASTSILVENMIGMSLQDARSYANELLQALDQHSHLDDDRDILTTLKHHNARMDCITLSWKELANIRQ